MGREAEADGCVKCPPTLLKAGPSREEDQALTPMENAGAAQPLGYESGSGTWVHPPGLRDHFGSPLSSNVDFFRPPPIDLGGLISAHSTLKPGKEGKSVIHRLLIALVFAIPITAAVIGFVEWMEPGIDALSSYPYPVLACAITLAIAWRATAFVHICTFVCVDGMVWHRLTRSRNSPSTEVRFVFRRAIELRVKNAWDCGQRAGQVWEFKWTDEAGELVYHLKGTHRRRWRKVKPSYAFAFGRSGEEAWTNFLLRTADSTLEDVGYLVFRAGSRNDVRVGQGFLVFNWDGEFERINVDEIKTVELRNGNFYVAHIDSGWFSRKGKFDFQYESMANARLFLVVVDRLLGLRLMP